MNSELPQYVSKTRFFDLLGVCFLSGQRLLDRGVLKPAAELHGETPLFIHSGEAIASARRAIQEYKRSLRHTRFNRKTTPTE